MMKKTIKKGMMSIILSLVMVIGLSAQNPAGKGFGSAKGQGMRAANCQMQNQISDLSEDQITELKGLRFEHQKEMLNYRNEMGVLRAQRRTIMSAYKIDIKAADKLTDEKTALMNQMMKAQNAHQASVKSVLTEEQALRYDQLRQGRGRGHRGAGMGQMARGDQGRGHGRDQGRGQGRGMGRAGNGI